MSQIHHDDFATLLFLIYKNIGKVNRLIALIIKGVPK